MIVDLTKSLIVKNPDLSHREARCLVNCARKAIRELSLTYQEEFDSNERPILEELIRSRWPLEEFASGAHASEIVN
jgi:hypothetical protein